MYRFNYHRPGTLDEAAELVTRGEEALVLAGGQTLIPTMRQRLAMPTDLVDLGGIAGLDDIRLADGVVTIGAMGRHAEVAASAVVREAIPALADLAGRIGDPQVRNRGTLGGSVANSDPAADYPAAVVGLDATVVTNRRAIRADDFFMGMFETALEHGELIREIRFPVPERAAYAKFPSPASRYAVVGVLVAVTGGGVRVGITGAAGCAFRAVALEEALSASLAPAAVAGVEIDASEFNSDLSASAAYRAALVKVMTERAVAALA